MTDDLTAARRRAKPESVRLQYLKRHWDEDFGEYLVKHVIVDVGPRGKRVFSESEPGSNEWCTFTPSTLERRAVTEILKLKVPCDSHWGVRLALAKSGSIASLRIPCINGPALVTLALPTRGTQAA